MYKLKTLYVKHREGITYCFFGGLTTIVSGGSRYAAHLFFANFFPYTLGATTLSDSVVSWICSVTFAFVVNKIFVFRNKSTQKREWLKQGATFYCARLATLGMESVFLYVTVDVLELNYPVMWAIVQVAIVIGNYLISKLWVFANKKDTKAKKDKNKPTEDKNGEDISG
jgi:putative flippase GtrA